MLLSGSAEGRIRVRGQRLLLKLCFLREGQRIKEFLRSECPLPIKMEQHSSKEPALYIDIIKHMVKTKGLKVSISQVMEFLKFIQKVCPWFAMEGTSLWLSHSGSKKETTKYHNSDWHPLQCLTVNHCIPLPRKCKKGPLCIRSTRSVIHWGK